MKKNIRLKLIIAFLIFGFIQIFNSNAIISFAGENITTQNVEDGTYIIKSAANQNYVIDVYAGLKNDGANVQLYQRNDSNAQKWILKKVDNKYYTITSVGSNKVLDVYAGLKVPGTNVWQYSSNNSDAQKWQIQKNSDNTYSIISKGSGLYIDINAGQIKNGSNIQVYSGNGTNAQKFILESLSINNKTIDDGTYAIKSAENTNYGLDIEKCSQNDGANLQIFKYEGLDNQKFKVEYNKDGYYTIKAIHSNKAIDIYGGQKIAGTNVWQYEANNSDAQKWLIQKNVDGTYTITAKNSGLCLDVNAGIVKNNANIQIYTKNGTNAQKFKFEKVNNTSSNTINEPTTTNNNNNNNNNNTATKTVENGTYTIETAVSSNYALDVNGGSKENGANIQIYKKQAVNRQKFNVEYLSDGYYKIIAAHSNKVLDVQGAGKTNGTNVWQYEYNNSDAQKWKIQKNSDNTYSIISKCNGLYLDLSGASAQNGSNIQVYEGNNSKAQKYRFVEPLNLLNTIDESKYPGYKEKISNLMNAHPGWNFELLYTGLTFDEVVKGEYSVHSRNLIPSTYSGEWVCPICGTKQYDSGWYCASEHAIAYYMDPRNFLDDTNVFQFQDLNEYIQGVCTLEGIEQKVKNTFLANYATAIDNACKNQNVNSYYIIARVLQEQGSKGTKIGTGMDGGDGKTYYNPFNIGASGNGSSQIYDNALKTAKANGWDSMQKALEGGITFCKKNWLQNYQNTLYQNKFDIDTRNGSALYEHQYMQNLMAAYSEARTLRSMYANTNKIDSNFTFIIPVYEKMDTNISQTPTSNSELSPINVQITANGGLRLRKEASTSSENIKTIAQGEIILSVQRGINSNWQKVITTDGTIGYMSGTYLKQVADVTNCNYTAKVKTSDGSGCKVRVGPSTDLDKITALTDGTTVTVINEGTYNNINGYNWYRVQLSDGRQGFMPSKFLTR